MLGFSNFFSDGIGPNIPQLASNINNIKAINPPKKSCQKIFTLRFMMYGFSER
jgi:hypothetical protein